MLAGLLLINGITDRDTIQIKVSAFRVFDFVGTSNQPAASRGPGSRRGWFEADFVVDRISESLFAA